MSTEELLALRNLAANVAAQDPAYAVTEYERAAITLARACLKLLEERQQLTTATQHTGPTLPVHRVLHPFHNAGG